jgi:NADPH2:quinone reductase
MKAVVYLGAGGPDALQISGEPDPRLEPGQAMIEVALCGVNSADLIGLRTGNNFLGSTAATRIPGGEVVGRLADTGQRVVAICGHGGFAERAAAPQSQIFPVPDEIDDATAIALLIQGLTAWHIVRTLGRLAPGESVLVHHAAGGVGLLALQIVRATGAARIVATASSAAKRELTLSSGAGAAVDANPEALSPRTVAANHGRPFDLVLERSGGDIFAQSLQATAPRGRIVCYGTSSGRPGDLTTGALIAGSRTVSGFWLMDFLRDADEAKRSIESVFALHLRGELTPRIGMKLPLENAADALRALASRDTVGKVLLDPKGEPVP